jgi:hypothetical protein
VDEVKARLEKEYGCSTPEEAETLLEELRTEVRQLDEKLKAGVEALQAKYLEEGGP